MGPEAWERAATEGERARLCEVLEDALVAGALGLSTSVMDTDRSNRIVPSRRADQAELEALIGVLARHDAVLQFVPRFLQPEFFLDDLERAARPAVRAGVRTLFAPYRLEVSVAAQRLQLQQFLAPYWAGGASLWASFSVRPSHVNMHFERRPELARCRQRLACGKAGLAGRLLVAGDRPLRLGRLHLHTGPNPIARTPASDRR
jgi:hypothetical protein